MDFIYFDNAASTPILPEVLEEVVVCSQELFGNPSSTHFAGRKSKNKIETARRTIGTHVGAQPSEIVFTSGATEANNFILQHAVQYLGVKTIISTKIEHKAVLEPIKKLQELYQITIVYLPLLSNGDISLDALEKEIEIAIKKGKVLLSIMAANNEIGNLVDLYSIKKLKEHYNFYFHSDTVQLIGHEIINFRELSIDFGTCSAHKFHGPKNVGFLYHKKEIPLKPIFFGGGQERGIKPGTENIAGIAGMAKALDISMQHLENDKQHIQSLKEYFKDQLTIQFNDIIRFNGNNDRELYTILNVGFKVDKVPSMLLFSLDMKNIAVSGGSACSSGSNQGSYVIRAIYGDLDDYMPIRFSFSKLNTKKEIDHCILELKSLIL